uniref:GIY-YIG nuclease family protein n=1 Tax=Agathobacter sp. TaxID=2021311 RepID=UPI0040571D9B
MEENYAYIVRCKDNSLYVGWTNNLEKRMKAHNEGKGAKYTKPRRPVKLVYYEVFATKQEAMSREYHLKKLNHKEKEKLIEKDDDSERT